MTPSVLHPNKISPSNHSHRPQFYLQFSSSCVAFGLPTAAIAAASEPPAARALLTQLVKKVLYVVVLLKFTTALKELPTCGRGLNPKQILLLNSQ